MMLHDARAEDAPLLLVLIAKYFAHDHILFDEPTVRRGLLELLSDPRHGHVWLFDDDAGYAIVTFGFDLEMGGRFALLTDLYLEPSHRGRGLGMRVIAEVERRLAALGVMTFELTVERGNAHAQALYRKAGFTARDRFPMTKRIA